MVRRFVLPAVFALAGYYALFGGEYSLLDTRAVHAHTEEARESLASLQAVTDSLAARADSLEHDDRTLEAIARERFGMIRDGEVLYRFALPLDEGEDGPP